MSLNQKNSSSSKLRYFLARFKPLTNYMIWGPPVVVLLVVGIVWQYQQHPEWLGQFNQPSTTQFFGVGENFDPDGEPLVPIEGENETLSELEDPLAPPSLGNSTNAPSPILVNPLNPTEQPSSTTGEQEPAPSIFPSLVPQSPNSAQSNPLFPSITRSSRPAEPVKPLQVEVPPVAAPSPTVNQALPPSSLDSFAQPSVSNPRATASQQRPRNDGAQPTYSGVNPQIPPTNYNTYPYGNVPLDNGVGNSQPPAVNYYPYGNQPSNPSVAVPQTPINTYRNQPDGGNAGNAGTQSAPVNPTFQPSLDNQGF